MCRRYIPTIPPISPSLSISGSQTSPSPSPSASSCPGLYLLGQLSQASPRLSLRSSSRSCWSGFETSGQLSFRNNKLLTKQSWVYLCVFLFHSESYRQVSDAITVSVGVARVSNAISIRVFLSGVGHFRAVVGRALRLGARQLVVRVAVYVAVRPAYRTITCPACLES